jgi:Flp pilus assembly protein TadG
MLLPMISMVAARKGLRRFGRNRHGSAAVEFAIVAPIFFALIFAIIETAMVFLAGQVLETAVQTSGRSFYTSQNLTETQLRTAFCSGIEALMDCTSTTKYCLDVRSFAKGAAIDLPSVVDAGGTYSCSVTMPSASAVDMTVVIRAYYQWPLFVTGLGYNIANIERGTVRSKRLLVAATAVRPQ